MSRLGQLIAAIGGGGLMMLMSSCRTVGVNDRVPMDFEKPVEQSIVFLIHGDADYLYHGADGSAFQADEEALTEALRVARQNPAAEVFIFHERPLKRRLFLFPRHDGTFYYFRGGKRVTNETYRRGKRDSRLGPEVAYYRAYRSVQRTSPVRMFVYMGHEIPEMEGVPYDASRRKGVFSVDHFTRALAGFTSDTGPVDLMVLSACYSGTPHTIGAMAPFAQTVVASPDNLHLSHLDLEPLERLDLKLGRAETASAGAAAGTPSASAVPDFARGFARTSFDRLTDDVQTVVTVAVYDMDRVQAYTDRVAPAYDSTLAALQDVAPARLEHVDCADTGEFALQDVSEGVDVLYRAPRFGRRADRVTHSGWQCRQNTSR